MKKNLLLGGVFAFLLGLVGWLLYLNFAEPQPPPRGPASARTTPARPSPARAAAPAGATPASTPQSDPRRMSVTLYFEDGQDDVLVTEEREADVASDPTERARIVLQELVKGPTGPPAARLSTLPEGTALRQVYLDATGIAYVDFSRELRDKHIGGSEGELMTVDAVVNTLTRNVPEVQFVRFLIEGRAVPTLAGHVDLSEPLRAESERKVGVR